MSALQADNMRRFPSMARGPQICHCEEANGRRGNLGKAVTFSPKVSCYPPRFCEIAPQGHFLALRAQGATSACGLLAMTNLWLSPFYRRSAVVGSAVPGPAVRSPTLAGTVLTVAGTNRQCRAGLSPPQHSLHLHRLIALNSVVFFE